MLNRKVCHVYEWEKNRLVVIIESDKTLILDLSQFPGNRRYVRQQMS